MRCSCSHVFAPTPETFHAPQLYFDLETRAVWLYLIQHRCPACRTLRSLIMFDATGDDDEQLEAIAAE